MPAKDKQTRIALGMPSHHGEINVRTKRSLNALIAHSHEHDLKLVLLEHHGSILPKNRNDTVIKALEWGADYLLFVDSDMVFEKDALVKLLAHGKDIVSGLAVVRQEPFSPVVRTKTPKGTYRVADGIESGELLTGLDGVGMAFTLLSAPMLKRIDPPWFAMPPYGEEVLGEDYYFCDKAKQAGYDICCDTSLIIGHIGEHIWTITDYLEYKAERERREGEE